MKYDQADTLNWTKLFINVGRIRIRPDVTFELRLPCIYNYTKFPVIVIEEHFTGAAISLKEVTPFPRFHALTPSYLST